MSITPTQTAPTADFETVTPAIARDWLRTNVQNRPVRGRKAANYGRDLAQGEWATTGEAIKFDWNGKLLDGQHRLLAIVETNSTVHNILVVRGLDPESQKKMDSGAGRKASDSLAIAGVKNSAIVSAMARFGISEPDAGFTDRRIPDPTHSEVLGFVNDHEETIYRAAELAAHFCKAIGVYPSALGVFIMRAIDIDTEACHQFLESIANSATKGLGDPRSALIRRLNTAKRNNERVSQYAQAALIVRCWNDWRQDRHIEKYNTESRVGMIRIPAELS